MRFANESEITQWDSLVCNNPDGGNVLQGLTFAAHKHRDGWTSRHIVSDPISILALEKSVPFLGKLWYIPKGPGVSSMRQLYDILPHLCTFAMARGVFLIKIEPELLDSPETRADLIKLHAIKSRPIQPSVSTVCIDLTPSRDSILKSLNQKGRHAIKRAERDGVTVQQVAATTGNCQKIYELLALTAQGSFGIRPYDYYKTFWQSYDKRGEGQMFFAYDASERLVAAAYTLLYGHKSIYKDGASIRERTAYGVSHLLQWQSMLWAKEHGSHTHDLYGTPHSEHINNTHHPYYGIGRFKTSFNKHVTDYIGTWDVPIRAHQYRIWTQYGERVLRSLSFRICKSDYY